MQSRGYSLFKESPKFQINTPAHYYSRENADVLYPTMLPSEPNLGKNGLAGVGEEDNRKFLQSKFKIDYQKSSSKQNIPGTTQQRLSEDQSSKEPSVNKDEIRLRDESSSVP
jgi:hypothetical protein